jgi:mannose-6-phosphate isomerase
MDSTPSIAPIFLEGALRHYDWGAKGKRAFIPRCLGIRPRPNTPYAELWFGDHPTAPSLVKTEEGRRIPLDQFLKKNARLFFPPGKKRKEARLPFLVKIIDAARPLSLQVHPDERQSRAGYARENRAGIPLGSPERSFPDRIAKPEFILALQPFDVLAGFSPWKAILRDALCRRILSLVPCRRPNTKRIVERLFTLSPEQVRAIGKNVFGPRISPALKGPRERWLLRLWRDHGFPKSDPACLASCFMNFHRLMPGESLEIRPGVPHTYLRGVGVEVMRNSDNVLRLGMTSKPVHFRRALKAILFDRRAVWPKTSSSRTLWAPHGKIRLHAIKRGNLHHWESRGKMVFFLSFPWEGSSGGWTGPILVSLIPGTDTSLSGPGLLIHAP